MVMTPDFLFLFGFGLLLLLLGRKLFWVYVGVMGFLVGFEGAREYLGVSDEWISIAAGLFVGAIAALLAVLLQYVAVAAGGFVGGAYLAMYLLDISTLSGVDTGSLLIIGGAGVFGMVLFLFILDPALIVLTSATGAALVVQAFQLNSQVAGMALIGLFLFGLIFQFLVLSKPERKSSD